jgi:hypothetical protein
VKNASGGSEAPEIFEFHIKYLILISNFSYALNIFAYDSGGADAPDPK